MAILGLFFFALISLAAAGTTEHAPSYHECNVSGDGCPWDEWCDTGAHPRKCWAKRMNGRQCNQDKKCLSGCCSNDKTCVACGHHPHDPCEGIQCAPGQYCHAGYCHALNSCSSIHCWEDEFCENGECLDKRPNGRQCNADYKCLSGCCSDHTKKCVSCDPVVDTCYHIHCESDEFCDNSKCWDKRPNGRQCSRDEKCLSGCCSDHYNKCVSCGGNPCHGVHCSDHEYCDRDDGHCYPVDPCYGVHCAEDEYCSHGHCVWIDPCHCPSGMVCEDEHCYLPYCYEDGDCPPHHTCKFGNQEHKGTCVADVDTVDCYKNWDCHADEYCTDEGRCKPYCYHINDCQGHKWCNDHNKCVPKLDNGDRCWYDYQCESGYCDQNDHPNRCQSKKDTGDKCEDNSECYSGWCKGRKCREKYGLGHSCEADYECESGSCDTHEHCSGWLLHWWDCASNTCVPIMGNVGEYCTSDYQCKSNKCDDWRNKCVKNDYFERHGFE